MPTAAKPPVAAIVYGTIVIIYIFLFVILRTNSTVRCACAPPGRNLMHDWPRGRLGGRRQSSPSIYGGNDIPAPGRQASHGHQRPIPKSGECVPRRYSACRSAKPPLPLHGPLRCHTPKNQIAGAVCRLALKARALKRKWPDMASSAYIRNAWRCLKQGNVPICLKTC